MCTDFFFFISFYLPKIDYVLVSDNKVFLHFHALYYLSDDMVSAILGCQTLFQMIGTLVTYAVVVIQFQQSAGCGSGGGGAAVNSSDSWRLRHISFCLFFFFFALHFKTFSNSSAWLRWKIEFCELWLQKRMTFKRRSESMALSCFRDNNRSSPVVDTNVSYLPMRRFVKQPRPVRFCNQINLSKRRCDAPHPFHLALDLFNTHMDTV